MTMLSTINKWIETAKGLIAQEAPIPLLDDPLIIDMTAELEDA